MKARVVNVDFSLDIRKQGFIDKVEVLICEVEVEGHPTDAMNLIYDTVTRLVGDINRPWSFKRIEFKKHGEKNSDWLCIVKAGLNDS